MNIRKWLIVAAATLLCTGAVASADPNVLSNLSLANSEAVVLQSVSGRDFALVQRHAAEPISETERAIGAAAVAGELGLSSGPNAASVNVPTGNGAAAPIRDGVIEITFVQDSRLRQTLLVIRNGLAHGFRYRAILHRGGQATPTDICDVAASHITFESWPYPVESIELSGFQALDWPVDRQPVCP